LKAVVGLGANLGDRAAMLREAARRVGEHARVLASSPVYETAPVGGPPQGDYLNAAMLVEWDGEAEALLDALLAIERTLGRERRVRWEARTIDLDVLWIEGVALQGGRLEVPHPRLTERAFAMTPLLDVAPDAIDPRTGRSFAPIRDAAMRVVDKELLRP
jgi:2-amino-4-hydroxy-6-hydroxymethyldihydropteridine diphosphokinase